MRHKKAFAWLHTGAFILFMILIAGPLFLPDPPEHARIWEHLAVFAREAIWTVWFPLVFLSVVFTGRSWCGLMCPMGAASEWVNKVGLKQAIPRWIEWPGTPIMSFLIVTVWGHGLGVRDHPEAMAWIFGTTMAAALIIGFLYGNNKRAWCRHMCPIGLMLGVFSRLGMLTFTPKRPKEGPEQIADKTVCPTRISLPHKKESRHCIACFRCVSPCAKGGLALAIRPPGQEIANIRYNNPNVAEVIFLFLATGIALGGFMWVSLPSYQEFRQWAGLFCLEHGLGGLLAPGAPWLVSVHPERREVLLWLDALLIGSYMLAWMLGIALLMAGVAYAVTRITHHAAKQPFGERFVELGYHLIPVAMVSLLIGLGGNLFQVAGNALLGDTLTRAVKAAIILASAFWGVWLCRSILKRQEIAASPLALTVSSAGNLGLAACWWPAIFLH